MRLKTVQDFKIEQHSSSGPMRFVAKWVDGQRRYHVWIDSDGQPDTAIHSNPLVVDAGKWRRDDHRTLDVKAKANAPMMADIIEHLATTSALADAYAAHAKYEADAAEAKTAEEARSFIDALTVLLDGPMMAMPEYLFSAVTAAAPSSTRNTTGGVEPSALPV
jgi:hypothetical protein